MNVDTTININARVVSIGAVILNCCDEVKAAPSKKIIGLFPSKVVEIKALGLYVSQEFRLKSPPCRVGYIDKVV